MCEIFPEVQSCCLVISLRLGMLFISVLCIMTGVTMLCVVEQRTGANFDGLANVTEINTVKKVWSNTKQLIVSGLIGMSVTFMITGIILLIAVLSDQDGLVQVFVWLTFLNVLVGFLLTLMLGVDCLTKSDCLLSDLDWLSASILIVMFIAYLLLWIYFITVANSHILYAYV